jgi:hypothetical protein
MKKILPLTLTTILLSTPVNIQDLEKNNLVYMAKFYCYNKNIEELTICMLANNYSLPTNVRYV